MTAYSYRHARTDDNAPVTHIFLTDTQARQLRVLELRLGCTITEAVETLIPNLAATRHSLPYYPHDYSMIVAAGHVHP